MQPASLALTDLLGIATSRHDFGDPNDPSRPAHVERKLQLSNLGKALTAPAAVLQSRYQWGGPGFDGRLLLPDLSTSLNLLGLSSHLWGS